MAQMGNHTKIKTYQVDCEIIWRRANARDLKSDSMPLAFSNPTANMEKLS